jgi:hypothetical protein
MDEQERKEEIAKLLEARKLIFKIEITNETKEFNNFAKIVKFVEKEKEYWAKYVSSNLNSVSGFYNQVNLFINNINSSQNPRQLDQQYTELHGYINSQKIHTLFSSSRAAQFLVRLHEQSIPRCNFAFNTIQNNNLSLNNARKPEEFQGILDAQNFLYQNETDAKDMIESSLAEAASNHIQETEKIRTEFDELKENYEARLEELKDKLDTSEKKFNKDISNNETKFKEVLAGWEQDIHKLEATYDNLLKLEKPARYWKTLKDLYFKKGKIWLSWAGFVSALFVLTLTLIFIYFPDWMLGEFKIHQAKGIVLLTVIISIFSYMVFTFIKLGNSAFHLSRDAEERRQLTYVYLSLIKAGGIEKAERLLILESLFARADTGLIKGDGTPQMPGINPLISKILESK